MALVEWLTSIGAGAIIAHVHPDHVGSATVAGRAGLAPTDRFVDGEREWRRVVRPRSTTPRG
jgi:RimJ/RimL family protein N-acetyltransferase